MTRRKVLIVSYWYPPHQAMGALRVAKMAEHLQEHGWSPSVITVSPHDDRYMRAGGLPAPALVSVHRTVDRSLHRWAAAVPGGSAEARTRRRGTLARWAYRLYRGVLCFPDECWPWAVRGYREILGIARQERPDVILSSSPPVSCHLIARRLSRELGVPWVAELRDLWTQNHLLSRPRLLLALERTLERRTLAGARSLVTVSEPLAERLRSLHGKPAIAISAGFDPQPSVEAPRRGSGPFSFVHTGLIYPGRRDPRLLIAALSRLVDEGELRPSDVSVRFFGRNLAYVADLCDEYTSVADSIVIGGEVSHQEALHQQRTADCLLLLEWVDPRAKGVYTGKLFEYLGSNRPILAIAVAGGVIDRLLEETGAGACVASEDEAYRIVRSWIGAVRSGGAVPLIRNEAEVGRYAWSTRARLLSDVLRDGLAARKDCS